MYMFICTFTNLNTNACDQKELMLKIFLSHFQLLIMNINFVAMTCIVHSHIYVLVRGVSIPVNEIFVHMDTFIQQMDMCLCNGKNSTIYGFYTSKDLECRGMIVHILHLIPFYNVFINNLQLFMSK